MAWQQTLQVSAGGCTPRLPRGCHPMPTDQVSRPPQEKPPNLPDCLFPLGSASQSDLAFPLKLILPRSHVAAWMTDLPPLSFLVPPDSEQQ